MGSALIVRRGGGGGIAEPFAVIYAYYMSGAVCTCTDGVTTLTAADTSGEYCFLLPNAGTWTVSAVKDGTTYSKAVSVTRHYQGVTVLLDKLYLIRDGVLTGAQSDWVTSWRNGTTNRVSYDDTGVFFNCSYSPARGALQSVRRVSFGAEPAYSKLCARFNKPESWNSSLLQYGVGYGDVILPGEENEIINNSSFLTGKVTAWDNTNLFHETELDVSNVTGEHYISIWVGSVKIHATDLWLE